MTSRAQFEASIGGYLRLDAVDSQPELSSRLEDIQVRCRIHGASKVGSARPELIRQGHEDATDLFPLLLFEGDDVIVDLDGAERLEKQARSAAGAAMDDARDRRSVFGPYDEHVASVAIGHDMLLQVLRGFLAAQI